MRRLFALGMLLLALGTVFPAAAEEKVPEPVYQDPGSYTEANQVLAMADSMLAAMDPGSAKYQAVQNAADYLRMLIGSGYASQEEVLAAMEALTRALGGVY